LLHIGLRQLNDFHKTEYEEIPKTNKVIPLHCIRGLAVSIIIQRLRFRRKNSNHKNCYW